MKKEIKHLQKGSVIRIVAPAKTIDEESVFFAKEILEKRGYVVEISKHCLGKHNFFSGTIKERLVDFQTAIDDTSIEAILCARGGYGSVQILDLIQWASFLRKPKWIIGYSDITYFHSKINRLEQQSIHGTVPLNFKNNSPEALDSLFNALEGKENTFSLPSCSENQIGTVEKELVGGNLSILYSLLGTNDDIDYTNKILFIEDLSEPLYSIDRMLFAFKKAGIFEKIKGLIVGGMTNLKDSEPPYGKNYKEIIKSHFIYNNIPICFDFPSGHIDDNRALIFGKSCFLSVEKEKVFFRQ